MSRLTLVDLFAGCGGGSLGFRAAGFEPISAVELDPDAAGSYEDNLGVKPIVDDVRKVSGERILEGTGIAPGELTLLFGCPPCQSFTVLRQGQKTTAEDRRRNKLPSEYLRLVGELRPRHIAFENVPGLAGPRGRRYLDWLLAGLEALGYAYARSDLEAADYGVPQRRMRLLVVGSRVATPELPAATHAANGKGSAKYRTVRNAIGALPPAAGWDDTSPSDPLHVQRNHRDIAVKRLRALKEGQARKDLPKKLQLECHQDHRGHYDIYGRMWWDKPAPTLTTGCTNVTRGRFAHPTADRAITLREALLLQAFPADTTLRGGIESASRQIGNAVPPLLAQRIGEAVLRVEGKAQVAEASSQRRRRSTA